MLLDAGADPDSSDIGTGLSPVCAAACIGNTATTALLKSKGARTACEEHTPLVASCEHGMLAVAKQLVNHSDKCTTIACAAMKGHMDMLEILHAQGAPLVCEAGGQLSSACTQQQPVVMKTASS